VKPEKFCRLQPTQTRKETDEITGMIQEVEKNELSSFLLASSHHLASDERERENGAAQ
jgi:SET domain-containing protein